MNEASSFGDWLQQRRKERGLTQAQLGQHIGCSASLIRKIEADERRPSTEVAALLADWLQLAGDDRTTFDLVARRAVGIDRLKVLADPVIPRSVSLHGSLPVPPTPFIGRTPDRAALAALLTSSPGPLVTLVGPPGIGKTRLSVQLANELRSVFPDGVHFVSLAAIRDADLILPLIAQALQVTQTGAQPLLDHLRRRLDGKQVLLVLDNMEQIVEAAPAVGELIAAVPDLRILATSREPLHVYGEQEYAVPPLGVPDPQAASSVEVLAQVESVRLFVQQAQAAQFTFQMTSRNAAAIAELCRRLEGLPLAIELAAARTKALPPEALLSRSGQNLDLLTGGAYNVPPRQRTLRNAIAWSYDLLDDRKQALFRRLSVFVGGSTITAAEAVCNAGNELPIGILDGIAALVDTSLLRRDTGVGDEPRFVMLETVREYARERLEERGEQTALQCHAEYYLALAERGRDEGDGDTEVALFDQWEHDLDNFRAALDWSHAAESAAEIDVRLATALTQFWVVRGYAREGWERLTAALARRSQVSAAVRARALSSVVLFAVHLGGKLEQVGRLLEEGLALMQMLGDRSGIAWTYSALGAVAALQGDDQRALERIEQSLALYRALDDTWGMTVTHCQLGELALLHGDLEHARSELEQSLTLCRHINGATWAIVRRMTLLGAIALAQGDSGRARELFVESLRLCRDSRDKVDVPMMLVGLAGVARVHGQLERAARLLGAGETVRDTSGAFRGLAGDVIVQRTTAAIRARIDAASFAAAWSDGRAMTLEQAIAYALDEDRLTSAPARQWPNGGTTSEGSTGPTAGAPGLTRREREVLRLVAHGLRTREVAVELGLSPLTVNVHLRAIYRKLGVRSRTAAARVAMEQHLV